MNNCSFTILSDYNLFWDILSISGLILAMFRHFNQGYIILGIESYSRYYILIWDSSLSYSLELLIPNQIVMSHKFSVPKYS